MKNIILYFIITLNIFFTSLYANPIKVDDQTKYIDILSKSQVYLDESRVLNIDEIIQKKFESNTQSALGFGYNPNVDVWVRFTLKNISDKKIRKIIEYDNPLSTNVDFYHKVENDYKVLKSGSFNFEEDRSTKNPIFIIDLKPNESKIYYIKATSYVTTLIVKLKLWSVEKFYDKEIKNQFVLALFFGAMVVLGIYNLFIFFITRDISYLFYVLYITGIIFHHLLYVGIGNLYLFDRETIIINTTLASMFVTIPIYSLALFTKTFLNTKQYKYWNIGLNTFLYIIPLFTFVVVTTGFFDKYRTLVALILFTYLVLITVYASYKRNRQAYYILFGWSIILIGAILMFLSSLGIFEIYQYFPYVIELIITLEALIFSIALAAKIRILELEKNSANSKLIEQQKNEQESLEKEVIKKTKELKDLNENLEEKVKEEVEHVKQIERKLFEAEKMAAMGEMMGNIAHQWRQPLSVISTHASGLILRREYGTLDDSSFERSLESIINMSKHLSQTIDDFRDYIRGDMVAINFFVNESIHKSISIVHASLKANFIQVKYDLEEDLEIENYENALTQSIVNIINNARDALRQNMEDQEKRFIFIKTQKVDDKILICIKDSAGGIPENIIDRIFEPYFTTKDKEHGTGLGLHMTYNMIINSMNGKMEVQNIEYEHDGTSLKGAEFSIYL